MTTRRAAGGPATEPADRIELLRLFARIVAAGSLTGAARELGTTQPAVSRRLQQLERRLGARLLERTTHELALTGAGEVLLAEAHGLVDAWDALAERVRGDGVDVRGLVKVVAPVALGQTLLVPIAARLRERHPELRFQWTLTDERVRLVEAGADCLIRPGAIDDPALVVRPVCEVERLLVAAPRALAAGEPAEPADLSRAPVVAVEPFYDRALRLHGVAGTARAGDEAEVSLAPVFRTDNMLAARLAAVEGVGVVVMPPFLVGDDLARGTLRRVLPDWEAGRMTIRIAWPAGRYRSRATAAFVDAVRRELPRLPGMHPVRARP